MAKKKETKEAPLKLLIDPDFTTFVNVNRWFSYDGVAVYIIVGGRGIGKTTGLNIHDILEISI